MKFECPYCNKIILDCRINQRTCEGIECMHKHDLIMKRKNYYIPEIMERKKKNQKEYNKRPEVKERRRNQIIALTILKNNHKKEFIEICGSIQ
jgi:hypothetical protein